jgi:hypothetical protein
LADLEPPSYQVARIIELHQHQASALYTSALYIWGQMKETRIGWQLVQPSDDGCGTKKAVGCDWILSALEVEPKGLLADRMLQSEGERITDNPSSLQCSKGNISVYCHWTDKRCLGMVVHACHPSTWEAWGQCEAT